MDPRFMSERELFEAIAYLETSVDDGHASAQLTNLRAHLAAQADALASLRRELEEAKAIPDGYVLVPIAPTKAMVIAGGDMLEQCTDRDYDSDADGNRHSYEYRAADWPGRVWAAMIAAAEADLSRAAPSTETERSG